MAHRCIVRLASISMLPWVDIVWLNAVVICGADMWMCDAVVGALFEADCSVRKKPGIGAWFAAVVEPNGGGATCCGWQCFGPLL